MSNPIITPNRKTIVTFDDPLPSAMQRAFAFDKVADEVALGPDSVATDVVNVPEIGWQLRGLQFDAGETAESDDGVAGILTKASGQLQTADGIEEFDTYRQALELTGVSYGVGVPANGSPAIQKRVEAGGSFNKSLGTDQSSFASPAPGEDPTNMDRIAVTSVDHLPDGSIHLRFFVPAGVQFVGRGMLTLYFSGPAGSTPVDRGNGQYALKLYLDGTAFLYERSTTDLNATTIPTDVDNWRQRKIFSFADRQEVAGRNHFLSIATDAAPEVAGTGGYSGTKIVFFFSSVKSNGRRLSGVLRAGVMRGARKDASPIPTYYVPAHLPNVQTQAAPLRLDVRRDMRPILQLMKTTYPVTGVLRDDPVLLPYRLAPGDGTDFIDLECFGVFPPGTNVVPALLDSAGVEFLGGVVTSDTQRIKAKRYPVPAGVTRREISAQFELSGDGEKTPTIRFYGISRATTFETPVSSPKECPDREPDPALFRTDILRCDVTLPAREMGEERASIEIADLADDLSVLRTRGKVPVRIELEYDALGSRTTIFRGYAINVRSERLLGKDPARSYPDPDARRYAVECAGEWTRLAETQAPTRFTWQTQEGGELVNYRITDIISVLLRIAYPINRILIDTVDVRLLSSDPDAYRLEVGSPIDSVVQEFAKDYLGGWVYFDPAAGVDGLWRLGLPKAPDAQVLARFWIDHPGDGKHAVDYRSYPDLIVGDQTVKQTFIRRGTLEEWAEPPEGNKVEVYGSASEEAATENGQTSAMQLSQVAYNLSSYNPFNLPSSDPNYPDPANPDYLGREVAIRVYDAKLTTQQAVDWVCRRIFDLSCHTVYRMKFEAPLILATDAADAQQVRPRPLRFYDFVEVQNMVGDWERWVVASVRILSTKHTMQMAEYELARPSNLDQLNGLFRADGSTTQRKNAIVMFGNRISGMAENSKMPTTTTKQASTNQGNWTGLPSVPTEDVQILDPADPNFGRFYFIPGFSRLGGPDILA